MKSRQVQPVRVLKWLLQRLPVTTRVLQLARVPEIEAPSVIASQPLSEPRAWTMADVQDLFAQAQSDADGYGEVAQYLLRALDEHGAVAAEAALGTIGPADDENAAMLAHQGGGDTPQDKVVQLINSVLVHDRANTRQHHHAMQTLVRLHQENASQQADIIRELRQLIQKVDMPSTAEPTVEEQARAVALDKLVDAALPHLPRLFGLLPAPPTPPGASVVPLKRGRQ